MLHISGYSERYRFNIIKGVITRHKELLRQVKDKEIDSLYRNRDKIKEMKTQKGGNSNNTWFISKETNNILMTTATPNSKLSKELKEAIDKLPTVAGGRTKPIEKGGLPVSIGLKKKDPFRAEGCDFNDDNCPVQDSQSCSTMGTCYRVICERGEHNDIDDIIEDNDDNKMNYVGTTGTSVHNRHKSHLGLYKEKDWYKCNIPAYDDLSSEF